MNGLRGRFLKILINQVVGTMLDAMTEEQVKAFLDSLIDRIETIVADSPNTIDDQILLPLIGKMREVLDIPDLADEVEEEAS